MSDCWASVLGDCGEGPSREHLVSKSAFVGEEIRVEGLSWCRHEPKVIGLSGLVSRILCRHHNGELSAVDQAGGEAVAAFRDFNRHAADYLHGQPKRCAVRTYEVQGEFFERWLLKCTINLCYGGS